MKKLLLFTALIAVMASCGKKSGYTINGEVTGLEGMIYLNRIEGSQRIAIDSAEIMNGKFTMHGRLENPIIATLSGTDYKSIAFLMDNGDITISAIKGKWHHGFTVNGTPEIDAFNNYTYLSDSLWIDWFSNETVNDEMLNKMNRNLYELRKSFIQDNPTNVAAAYLLSGETMSAEETTTAYDKLQEPAKSSFYGLQIKERAKALGASEIGSKFIDFSAKDSDGKEISLSSMVGSGKYVLLDFWAGWCGPCIAEMPHLKVAYAEYNSKGFEVYAYSLDRTREQWVNAMEEHGLNWTNTTDLGFWDSKPAKMYAVSSIPANFLIGPDGTIVAKNLRGEALSDKLAELLD